MKNAEKSRRNEIKGKELSSGDFEALNRVWKKRTRISLNKQVVDEVAKELRPLLSVLHDRSLQYEGFTQDMKRFTYKLGVAAELTEIQGSLVKKIAGGANEQLRLASFSAAMFYLCSVELLAGTFVNLAIMLLVAKGRFLHLEPDYDHRYTRHANSLEDIESPTLPLSVKLDFLKSNGLTYFSKWINKNLRNGIAHSDFEIDDTGSFFLLRKGKRKKVDLARTLNLFKDYSNATLCILTDSMQKAPKARRQITE